MSHGLYFDANYTLAKNLADNQGDNPTAFAGEVNYGVPIADRFNVHSDYGNVEGTRRQRFLFTGIYQLPVGEGRPFLNAGGWKNGMLGGWELTSVTLVETGPWLTPSISPGGCQVAALANGACPSLAEGQPETNDQSNTNVVNRGGLPAARSGVDEFLSGPVTRAILQPGGVFADSGRSGALRQRRSRHPAGSGHGGSQPRAG
jgi:hypothetical protein